jgi:hypothetical protein
MGSHGLPESLPELEGLTNQMPKNKPGQDRQDRTKPLVGARAYSVRTAQKWFSAIQPGIILKWTISCKLNYLNLTAHYPDTYHSLSIFRN